MGNTGRRGRVLSSGDGNPLDRLKLTGGTASVYTCTTTLVDEVAYSIKIPAGTAITNDFLNIHLFNSTTASTNNKFCKVWLCSAAKVPGATITASAGVDVQVAQLNANSGTGTIHGLRKSFGLRSSTTIIAYCSPTSNSGDDTGSNSIGPATVVTVPTFANDIYLVVSLNRAIVGDTFTVEKLSYEIQKNLT